MGSSNLASMAWRNLWRNRRRTLLTLSSIAFGTGLAIMFTGLGDSNWRGMIDLAARMGGGHVTIQHPEYLDTPTLSRTLSDVAELQKRALADSDVERVVSRISGNILLLTAAQNRGAGFIAYDPATEDATTLSVLDALVEGELFTSADTNGIILGQKLAQNLETRLGRKVVFTLTDKYGEILQEAVRVTGIIATGSPSIDAGLALLPIGRLRTSLRFEADEATQLAVFLSDQRAAHDVASRLGEDFDRDSVALTWQEVQPDLAGFIAMKIAGAQFMEAVIMVLVAAGIFNTIFVSVMERLREFGVMMAIGFSPGRLFGLVMFESLWLGLCGLALAGIVTAWPYHYMYTKGFDISAQIPIDNSEIAGVALSTVMRVDIYPENGVIIAALALLATLLSGLYPAWNAGRVAPVEAIRVG
ncbi:MAG: FtsX-like permease family protein [Myxococcota bacterium]